MEKLFAIITSLSIVVSGQLLTDIPGVDIMDIKDIPGFYTVHEPA